MGIWLGLQSRGRERDRECVRGIGRGRNRKEETALLIVDLSVKPDSFRKSVMQFIHFTV